MATNYEAAAASDNRPAVTITGAGQASINHGKFTVETGLVVDDTVALCKLPAGHIPIDFVGDVGDLDDGTALVFDVGIIDDDVDCLISGSTAGQAGGLLRMTEIAGRSLAPTDADRLIGITVTTAPGTASTGGVITGTLFSRVANQDD